VIMATVSLCFGGLGVVFLGTGDGQPEGRRGLASEDEVM